MFFSRFFHITKLSICFGLTCGTNYGVYYIPLTIFIIVFIINAINFIDGIDGLAAGISMLAFLFFGFTFLYFRLYIYSIVAFSALGMLVPFFYYNMFGKENKQTKIFMGDCGSLTIGMLLSIFAVKVCHYDPNGTIQSPHVMVFAFAILIIPLFDAMKVILYRIYLHKSPFKPDKNHIHHQFLQLGFSHKTIMLMILMIAISFGVGSVLLAPYLDINLLLGLIVLLWIIMDTYLRTRIKHMVQSIHAKSKKTMKQTKSYTILVLIMTVAFSSSCSSTKKISYFQDIEPGIAEQVAIPLDIKIRPNDKISIVVNSKDAELSNLFNLPIVSHRIGSSSELSLNSSAQQISGYTVDANGDIDFPVIGKVHVGGLIREQIAAHIKHKLITGDLVKDPVVTVEFMNLGFSVLGEVNRPGRFYIDHDRMTLLEAIGLAGDLTIYGKRDAVYVLRQGENGQISYLVDLSSMYSLYASPVFYVQQNDVIYVEPNSVRARHSTVNGNNVRSTSFWLSLASLAATITMLFVKLK